jgi:uncharacterized protein (DUF58 family)
MTPPRPASDARDTVTTRSVVLVTVLIIATAAWLVYAVTRREPILTLLAAAVTIGVGITAAWLLLVRAGRVPGGNGGPRGNDKRAKRPAALRPTPRGLAAFFCAPLAWAVGRAIGSPEMLSVAAAIGVGWIVALVVSLQAGRGVRLQRSAPADEVFAGESIRITYRLHAAVDWLWPVRAITERLGRRGSAPDLLSINGVVIGRPTAVQFDALPRGVFLLGPATVVRADPFGLFERRVTAPSQHELRVWPRTVALADAMAASGLDDSGAFARAAREGTEFKGLREYADGDDPRRIHWPSSAKRDVMLVRETQADVDPRAVVVLDCRRSVYTDASTPDAATSPTFETAVSTAASAVAAFARLGWEVALYLVHPDERHCAIEGPAHIGAALDLLAGADLTDTDAHAEGDVRVRSTWDRFERPAVGALVVATGSPDAALIGALRRRSGQFSPRVIVACTTEDSAVAGAAGPLTWVTPRDLADLPAAWVTAALRSSGPRRTARRRTTLGARR